MVTPASLSGPLVVPSGATCAVVCLHGFGADGNDFVGIQAPLQALLPDGMVLAVFCPNGVRETPFGQGYQWFSDKGWTFRDREGIDAASKAVWAYVQADVVAKHGIPLQNVVLMGFSQGAMTALYAAPRWPEVVGGVIAHSGLAMWQEELDASACRKPPVLLLHGVDDDVVPADQSVRAAEGLRRLGFEADVHLLEGLGHGVNGESLARMGLFLGEIFST